MAIVKSGIMSNVGVEVGYLDIVEMQYVFATGITSIVVEGWASEQAKNEGKVSIYRATHTIPQGANVELMTDIASFVYPYIQTNYYGE